MPDEGTDTGTQDSSEVEASVDFGADLVPDSVKSELAAALDEEGSSLESTQESRTEEQGKPAFDPSSVDWLYARDEDVPEEFRVLAQQGRASMAKMQQTLSKERSNLQTEFDQKQLEVQQPARPAAPAPPPASEYNGSSNEEMEFKANLVRGLGIDSDKDWQAASNIVYLAENLAQRQISAATMGMETKIVELRSAVESLGGQVTQQSAKPVVDQVNAEMQEAAAAGYTEDIMQGWGDVIIGMRRQVNPVTSKAYTVKEAFERVSGKTAAVVTQANGQQVLENAQSRVGGPTVAGMPASDVSQQGSLSVKEAESRMATLLGTSD